MSVNESKSSPLAPGREMRTYPSDLTVVVGTEPQESFQCHGAILAHHSEYIDNMLSAPMKENANRTITFPDINPETWKKMMKVLGPSIIFPLKQDDLLEVAPLFDKYQFTKGLDVCDEMLAYLVGEEEVLKTHGTDDLDAIISIIQLAHGLNLKKSKPIASKCAAYILTQKIQERAKKVQAEHVKALVPFVDQEIVRYMVETICECRGMTMADMLQFIEREAFAADYLRGHQRLNEKAEFIEDHVKLEQLRASLSHERNFEGDFLFLQRPINGYFRKIRTYPLPGVMGYSYRATDGNEIFRAMDPHGKKWQLRVEEHGYKFLSCLKWNFEEPMQIDHQASYLVVLFWESDQGSLVPPKSEWKLSQPLGDGEYVPRDMTPPSTDEFEVEYNRS